MQLFHSAPRYIYMEQIKKYMQNRKLITFICDCCGKEAQKPLSEYNRNKKLGRKNFCSRSCAIRYANKNKLHRFTDKCREHLLSICGNQRDEYTGFRYALRSIRKRFKEVDIDLEYLKQLWELQKGICPYTGIKLKLPTYGKHNFYFDCASLDRIDSSKGYVKGNVQFVSLPINLMKSTKSDIEIKQFLKQISFYTSHFCEDETISSPQEVLGAQAGN